ncbi:MAG: bifunctional adenosylcobinamide kinase/adenosylcobinamide-phosphate guanylyltransferase [Acidimicrobiia bacterium]
MALTILLGGARSGKSKLAGTLMTSGSGPVTLIATAEGGDQEMQDRILEHQRSRPADWTLVEEPLDLEGALSRVEDGHRVIVDCLTLWVSNLIGAGLDDDEVRSRAGDAAALAAARELATVVVSNEVGSGIVPVNDLARRYRDVLGRVNALWAEASDHVYLTVAGGVVPVRPADSVWGEATDG